MSERTYGDPLTQPFWKGAEEERLLIQRCRDCGACQHYARPFCLSCNSAGVEWVESKGSGTIYSATTVRVKLLPDLDPPYVVALVDLDEGPRLLTNVEGGKCRIGDRVELVWRRREGKPPFPQFRVV